MKTVCLFASYYTTDNIPYYIKCYLKELHRYFPRTIFLSSQKLNKADSDFLNNENIVFQLENNEGFDFGMWYKAFQKIDVSEFDQILLVNDSCVLFKSLDPFMKWAAEESAEVKGMTLSEAVTPHVQSYFMLLNKKAIDLASEYFKENKIKHQIDQVIKTYELGLNKRFTDTGLKLAAFVNNDGYKGEFSPYYKCIDHHLRKGIPLIKKKILYASYRKDELPNLARMGLNIDVDRYYKFMYKQKDLVIDLEKLFIESPSQMSSTDVLIFNFKKMLIKFFRPFYKAIKK